MTQILIVDDNEQNLYMLQVLLESQGYNVQTARNGNDALSMARQELPDLIITDILMPGMDGFSLCREWVADETLRSVPLVFYTATYTDPKDEEFALSLGAARFLVKPAELDVFTAMVRDVLENHAADRLAPAQEPDQPADVYYEQYNKALIRKLEDKMVQLEEANRLLELDIAARRQAEAALEQYAGRLEEMVEERTRALHLAQEELVRRERLAILGELAGAMGHELRNPMGVIKNVAFYFRLTLQDPDVHTREMLDVLDEEVARGERVIASLLKFAQPTPPVLCAEDLNALVQDAMAEKRQTLPPAITTHLDLDESLAPIECDGQQVRQMLDELVRNSVQAMPGGGELTITTKAEPTGWIVWTVADTGQGIAEEDLPRIFEPLFTTKAKGIGLGLPVTKTLVDGHGGDISVESRVGVGTTFSVRLPIDPRQVVAEEDGQNGQ